jgi:malate dehydrogenase
MIRAVMGGDAFRWPSGCYVNTPEFGHIMMAMETTLNKNGVSYREVRGTDAEMAALRESYGHLVKMRDEVIAMGTIPPVDQWNSLNPNL